MQKIVILGAGGLAREVLDVILACNSVAAEYEPLGFIDDNPAMHNKILNGFPVLGGFNWFDSVETSSLRAVCVIGSPASRYKVVQKAVNRGLRFCNLVHPTAVVTQFVSVGEGTVITAGCVLTNQIRIGDHVYLNLNCTVGHDCVIEDYCNINPGVHISGNVRIKEGCDIGTGAVIVQNVVIGEWTIVGAGAVVVGDVPPNVTSVGVPAKTVKTRPGGWHNR